MSLWRVLTSAVNLCMWVVCNSPHKGKISTPSNWNAPLSVQRRQGGQIYATVTHKQVMEIWMITIFTCESICVFTSRSTGCLMKVTSSEQGLSPTALKQRVRWDSWPPASELARQAQPKDGLTCRSVCDYFIFCGTSGCCLSMSLYLGRRSQDTASSRWTGSWYSPSCRAAGRVALCWGEGRPDTWETERNALWELFLICLAVNRNHRRRFTTVNTGSNNLTEAQATARWTRRTANRAPKNIWSDIFY